MIPNNTENRNLNIKSKMVSLEMLAKDGLFFNIPIYQRLFVWGSDQINTLLEDLYRAFQRDDDYYLGGIMIAQNNDKKDLIDGQQRFTTLWLLGYLLKYDMTQFVYHINKQDVKPRLSFSIRDFANQYFTDPSKIESISAEERNELVPIVEGMNHIKRFLEEPDDEKRLRFIDDESKKGFSKYVFERVKFISTEMLSKIDENKLFEVMNNRGVQLQHHEILKARLLEKLDDIDKTKYAKLWDACSIMDEYIEKNLKDVLGCTWKDLTFNPEETEKEVRLPQDILSKILDSDLEMNPQHLLDILNSDQIQKQQQIAEDILYDSGKNRSIISFPMLLLHSLRIFLFNEKQVNEQINIDNIEINEKKLLTIFEKSFEPKFLSKSGVEDFIKLLWRIRVGFDKHVIKWIVRTDNSEIHLIKKLYLNKDALQRKEPLANEEFALLQSMLYHSQQIITHYWLTPFLYKILENDDPKELYLYLQKLDNVMFCSQIKDDLRTRSWNLIGMDCLYFTPKIEILTGALGTGYWSYWFYKLEFILWFFRDEIFKNSNIIVANKEAWNSYRMTKKNSVEHISPQNPSEFDNNKVWDETIDTEESKRQKLDDFGNLVLLSVGMNSEYSNKTFNSKRTDFKDKRRLDSLKSALIFENIEWNWALCENHRNEMIKYFVEYFNCIHNEVN